MNRIFGSSYLFIFFIFISCMAHAQDSDIPGEDQPKLLSPLLFIRTRVR